MKKNMMNAIQKKINSGETRFHIGKHYYECDVNGIIRRREQTVGCLPASDWEKVADWNPATGMIEQ